MIKKQTSFNLNKVVYNLIYPAFLGSMLYAMFPNKYAMYHDSIDTTRYWFNLGVVFLYLLDYYQQYIFFGRSNTDRQSPPILILIDIIVALCLWTAFNAKYHIAFLCLLALPFLFIVYPAYYTMTFRRIPICCMHFVYGCFAVVIYFFIRNKSECFSWLFIFYMVFIYFFLIIIERKYDRQKDDKFCDT